MTTVPRNQAPGKTVLPPDDLDELLDLTRFLEQHEEPAILLGPDGEQVPLPLEIYRTLIDVVDAMRHRRAVMIAPVGKVLTTQGAADLLGISRPTLIRLLDEGKIPFECPSGGRHRRLRIEDVLNYQRRQAVVRSETLEELVDDAEELGLYDLSPDSLKGALEAARKGRGRQ